MISTKNIHKHQDNIHLFLIDTFKYYMYLVKFSRTEQFNIFIKFRQIVQSFVNYEAFVLKV